MVQERQAELPQAESPFPTWGAIASTRVDADTLIARGPVLFWGVILSATAAATALNLRNGQDVLAPIKWDLEAEATVSTVVLLPRPVLFEFGIFADVDANILSAIVLFEYVSAVPHALAPPAVIEQAEAE